MAVRIEISGSMSSAYSLSVTALVAVRIEIMAVSFAAIAFSLSPPLWR